MSLKPHYHGLLLWNKPTGVTSFQALHPIKRALGKLTKVGHAGTLDKAAQGLKIVLVGAFTKLNPIFSHLDKEYVATITFGYETTTLDMEGQIIQQAALPSKVKVLQALESHHLGTILQAPPLYSAIHIAGKRAYQYAQTGQNVEMKSRPVQLHHVKLIELQEDGAGGVKNVTLKIACGVGFYVRSFARDLAYACKSVATLSYLERIGIGNYQRQPWVFSLSQAVQAPEQAVSHLLTAEQALGSLTGVQCVTIVDPLLQKEVRQGAPYALPKALCHTQEREQPIFLLDREGLLLAQAYRKDSGEWGYQFVVASND